MPGDESATRRSRIGVVARLRTWTSMVAGAVAPDPKKSSCASSSPIVGSATSAGRALPVPHATRRSINPATAHRFMTNLRLPRGFKRVMEHFMKKLIIILALVASTAGAFAQTNLTRLLRQPDIHGDTVAFVYGGDIWLASAKGGEARRLTSDAGMEYFPKFSPDGKWIAFTGDYSGSRQVFVISVDGGMPRQLTFYNDVGSIPPRGGIDNRVLDWTPDGKSILFNPHRLPWSDRMPAHYIIPFEGGMETKLAIPEGSAGSYSPDGKRLAFTHIEREFRTWKHYRGGRAQDVWIFDLTNNSAEKITDTPWTDNQPVWIGDTIYFVSDRPDGARLNLWSYDLKTKQTKKVTSHTDFDVLWPSGDRTQVVYENGGYIYRFDSTSGKDERIPIHVYSDFKTTLPYFKNVQQNIESYSLSPGGARALCVARGDVFTAPAKEGEIRNETQTPGIRERDASWSPDGKWIAYLSDRDGGDYEIYVRNADGSGGERQITHDARAWRFAPIWSPDSKMFAFSDKDLTLRVVDVASGKVTDVDKDQYGDITHYRWSPDSKWIAYTKLNEARFPSIYVYSVGDAKSYRLTNGRANDQEPVFDPKGRYLYFTSTRDFNLTFSAGEFNYVYTDPQRVYVATLSADGPALFLPQSDEEKATTPPAPEKKEEPKKDAAIVVKIDPAGFENRVRAIPGPSGTYDSLVALNNGILYLTGDGNQRTLKFYNIDDRKEETIVENIRGYDISNNLEKLIVRTANGYSILAPKPGPKPAHSALKLEHLEMKVDPRAEWAQELTDAWRILRDWFYDPNMHGNDWNAIRAKYGALLPFVANRNDLDYIFGELAGELNAGHVYVSPAPGSGPDRVDNGLLGADIVPDSGYFRIAHIFPGENWQDSSRSPLTQPGGKGRGGDYILAVDGPSTKGVDNFYRLLENKATRVVSLLVNSKPDTAGAHEEKVRPVKKETNLRYLDW